MSIYFMGLPGDLGNVSALPIGDFNQLCGFLSFPQELVLKRAEYDGLSAPAKSRAKRVRYITPASFKNPTSPRKTENATVCNLIALDVDNADEAKRILEAGFECLAPYGHVVWHTASSTTDQPRLRVLVKAESIPVVQYSAAARSVGELLGLTNVNKESTVAVQPMFLPTMFADDQREPIIISVDGDAFSVADIIAESESSMPATEVGDDLGGLEFLRTPMEGVTLEDAKDALNHLDPDCSMQQWIEVAASLKHQFGEPGLALWDEWSSRGEKYVGDEMEYRWSTLKANPSDREPVTIRSLFKLATARGWVNLTLTGRIHAETIEWINSPARSTEELLDGGIKRIAKAGPAIGFLEKKTLMVALRDVLAKRNIPLPLPDIKRAVHKLELEAAKTTGVPAWAKGLCYVTSLDTFYRPVTDRRFPPQVLDRMYSTPSIGDDKPMSPSNYLLQVVGCTQVENLRYHPGETKRFFSEDQVPYVNTYRRPGVVADATTSAAAGKIFLTHIANLVREIEYQRTLIDFMAFHVQQPGKKIRWAVLLQGTQGCGKTALAVMMTAVLGRRNVKKLSAKNVMTGNHNDWAYGSQLVTMEEVRVVGSNRHAIMDQLKPCISDDEISLHKKFEDHRTVPNITNYLMFTNHHDALAINDDDRRYFVIASPLQRKADVLKMGGAEYFNQLFGMIRDNAGGLRHFLENWKISPSFNAEDRAPLTPYLNELVENAASPLAAAVAQTISDGPHPLVRPDLLSLGCLRGCLDTEHLADFSDQALAAVLRESGWKKEGRWSIDGTKQQIWSKDLKTDARSTAEQRIKFL